jgi:hypothetical protein
MTANDGKILSPDFEMILDGKRIDEPLHAPLLESREGNRLSDLAGVEAAIAAGFTQEEVEELYGPIE